MVQATRARSRRFAAAAVLPVAWLVCTSPGPNPDASLTLPVASAALEAAGFRELWMAPDAGRIAARWDLARAVEAIDAGRPADAVPVLSAAVDDAVLGAYAAIHAARAHLALGRPVEAARLAEIVLSRPASDAAVDAALLVMADAADAAKDPEAAARALARLADRATEAPAAVHLRWLKTARAAGDRASAARAFDRLYFDFAGTTEARAAMAEAKALGLGPPAVTRATAARHLARAEALYAARLYTDARAAFSAMRAIVTGADRETATLRVAQCDLFLKHHAVAATALRTYLARADTRRPEAEFHLLLALKGLGRIADYVSGTHAFVERGADPELAERALSELGTYYVLANDDEKAAAVFAEQYARFPTGATAGRAAWRAGWWAYKQGDYAETIRLFESAAVGLRRSDYRPSWLYWAARSYDRLGRRAEATLAYRRVIADYRNSYYGRAAAARIGTGSATSSGDGPGPMAAGPRASWPVTLELAPRPPNAVVIEDLLAAGMHELAIAELRRLQAAGQGSSLVEATLAYALHRQGRLRPAITSMRRAYPQFMAEGGEALPVEILTVIFPIAHWDLLQAHAEARGLDRFLVAALVAQESTFQADIRSPADAWGLMQIIPATGRRYAARLGITPFTTRRLVDPEVNVRIGTTYLADLLKRYGDVAAALAAYNAGEARVDRWRADRPGMARDEFIDDIPFPETQNYVKRIIGTTEDYRILYDRPRQ